MVAVRVTIPRISRWLLGLFSGELTKARERYATFVRAGEPDTVP